MTTLNHDSVTRLTRNNTNIVTSTNHLQVTNVRVRSQSRLTQTQKLNRISRLRTTTTLTLLMNQPRLTTRRTRNYKHIPLRNHNHKLQHTVNNHHTRTRKSRLTKRNPTTFTRRLPIHLVMVSTLLRLTTTRMSLNHNQRHREKRRNNNGRTIRKVSKVIARGPRVKWCTFKVAHTESTPESLPRIPRTPLTPPPYPSSNPTHNTTQNQASTNKAN